MNVKESINHAFSVSPLAALPGYVFLIPLVCGGAGFLFLCLLIGVRLPWQNTIIVILLCASFIGVAALLRLKRREQQISISTDIWAVMALATVFIVMALSIAYQLTAYILLPVDLLSFSESPFVNDILKLRMGLPIYSAPQDNTSYPYTPGTQILTYLISAAFGGGDSIVSFRIVQFSYVVLAAIIATSVCDLLGRRFLSASEYKYRPLWIAAWLPMLFMLVTEPRFNQYNHSLHNDGLALLLSVCAFWLIVKHSIEPRAYQLVLMALLPVFGFSVKQSMLLWAGIFALYLVACEKPRWRQATVLLAVTGVLVLAVTGLSYALWGSNYIYWIFEALGNKKILLGRSAQHLFEAGIYGAMGLVAGWILVLRNGSRTSIVLWLCWLLLFSAEAYTSGIGFQVNHLGPGVVIGGCWFFVALLKIWPSPENAGAFWRCRAQEAVAVSLIVLFFGALGFVKVPHNPVPPDFFRYIANIEEEFQGLPTDKVLMDTGTWIYLQEKVLMKDRSAPVSLHVGINQPEINHKYLEETINRIKGRQYDKILARQLDTGETWYDFQDRGSGVKSAILENYRELRRIPGVRGIEHWWPGHLIADIVVLVPKQNPPVVATK